MSVKTPALLALDFDGVVCDGLKEYFQTAWKAYCEIWQPAETVAPAGLAEVFYRLRPVVETGWEMPVVLRALLSGDREAEILEHWNAIASTIISNDQLKPLEISGVVDAIRDRWIAEDIDSWLGEHRFYPGVIDRIRKVLASSTNFAIISTKEGRFIKQLLHQQGVEISDNQVYGKESKRPKHEILKELKAEDNAGAPIWFVEDRMKTLQVVQHQSELEDVQLFLANWGYNTASERQEAFRNSRVHLISLDQFCQNFPLWI